MADGPIRRKKEKAVRDRAGVPVLLLYDETNDETKMARSSEAGGLATSDLDDYWNQVQYDYDVDENLIYKGKHHIFNALTSDFGYLITKYTYTTGNLVTKQQTYGSWDGRAGIGW